MKLLGELLLLILLIDHPQAGTTSVPIPTATPQSVQVLGIAKESGLITSINSIRASHGVFPLRENRLLDKSALNRACYLYKNNIWSHEGDAYTKFIAQVGYLPHPKWVGENLARRYNSDQEVINAWVASPTHLANILDRRFVEIGVGRCYTYIVTFFGGR